MSPYLKVGVSLYNTNSDGDCDASDANQIQAWINTSQYDLRGDLDLDGDVDATDKTLAQSASNTLGRAVLSGVGNRCGRAGYSSDDIVNGSAYVVRRRTFSNSVGRWLQRDPADASPRLANAYEYCSSEPVTEIDPFGLQGTGPETLIAHAKGQSYTGSCPGFAEFDMTVDVPKDISDQHPRWINHVKVKIHVCDCPDYSQSTTTVSTTTASTTMVTTGSGSAGDSSVINSGGTNSNDIGMRGLRGGTSGSGGPPSLAGVHWSVSDDLNCVTWNLEWWEDFGASPGIDGASESCITNSYGDIEDTANMEAYKKPDSWNNPIGGWIHTPIQIGFRGGGKWGPMGTSPRTDYKVSPDAPIARGQTNYVTASWNCCGLPDKCQIDGGVK